MKKTITFKIDESNPLLSRTVEQIDKNLPTDIQQRQRLVNKIRRYFPNGITVKYIGDINDPNVQQLLSTKIQLKILSRLFFDMWVEPITLFLIYIVIGLLILTLIKVIH